MTSPFVDVVCPECGSTASAVRVQPNQLVIQRHATYGPADSAHDGYLHHDICFASGCFLFEPTPPSQLKPPLSPAEQAEVIRKRRNRSRP